MAQQHNSLIRMSNADERSNNSWRQQLDANPPSDKNEDGTEMQESPRHTWVEREEEWSAMGEPLERDVSQGSESGFSHATTRSERIFEELANGA